MKTHVRNSLAVLAIGLCISASLLADELDDAMHALGFDIVVSNYEAAANAAKQLANEGDSGAQLLLGLFYEHGKGVPRDYAEAFIWYQKAAEQGFYAAEYFIGRLYSNGHGVPRSYVEAIKRYRAAADHGDMLAQFQLGYSYSEGIGVPQDYAAALKWYRQAAEQGHDAAQYNLGVMYAKGEGVPQDCVQAHKWLNLASANAIDTDTRLVAAKARERCAATMTPEQIATAQKLAREWKPK